MSVSKNARRMSLLASSSLVAASLIAGVAGLSSLAVAPGVALAADECGNPSANAGGTDVFVCAGAFGGIDYTATTNGNLTLNLEDGVTVTNGIAVTGNAGEQLTIRATTNVANSGDPSITNAAGYAINVQGSGAAVRVDLRSGDVGGDVPVAVGGGRGINATNSVGFTEVYMNEGAVNAAAGFGINATAAGHVVVNLTNGSTVTASGTAVRAISTTDTVNVFTTGLVSSNNVGIFANGSAGVTIETGAVTAAGAQGISATSTGGSVAVTTHGAVTGQAGIVTTSTANGTTIDLGGDVTGTAGNGITSTVNAGGLTITANGNAITGTADGVNATANGNGAINLTLSDVSGLNGVVVNSTVGNGAVTVTSDGLITATGGAGVNVAANGVIDITVNDVTATGNYGVIGVSGAGDVTATVAAGGTVVGNGGVGVQAGGAGNTLVTLGAGSNVTATNIFSYGVYSGALGSGNATADLGGNVLDGGVGVFANTGDALVSGSGNVNMSALFDAVQASSNSGLVTVNLSGDINSTGANAINANSTSGAISVTTSGALTGGANGILASSTTGAVTINTTGGSIGSGANGINASSGGLIDINNGAVITAGGTGILASGSGGVDIDTSANVSGAVGIGATGTGAGTTLVNVQAAATVTGTAGDAINTVTVTGANTVDTAGTISATGGDGIDASSTSGLVTINANGGTIDADGVGILAVSDGGVDVNNSAVVTGGTFGISGTSALDVDILTFTDVSGATGISATGTGAGTATVTLNAGATVTGTAGNGVTLVTADGQAFVNSFGDIDATGGDGVNASSTNGNVFVYTGPGSITATGGAGINASTSGTGLVSVIDFGGSVSGDTGIVASATGTGSVGVSANLVTSTAGDGVNVSATSGSVSVVASNTIDATGGDGIDASTSAGGSVSVTGAGAILGGADYGILATTTGGGNIDVIYTGDIGASGDPTTQGGVLALADGGAGTVNVSVTADVYTDGLAPYGAGVAGVNLGTSGAVTVAFDGTMVSGTVGVGGAIENAGNGDDVLVTVADGSSITAGEVGVLSSTNGAGSATTTIGAGVIIDPNDYGSYTFSAGGDATATTGAGTTILIGNTDADNVAYGVYAESGAAADAAVGDPAVEITIGADNTIVVDDGLGGEADGGAGIVGVATGAAGSVDIAVGTGLDLSLVGDNAVGIGGFTVGGDITITTDGGVINVAPGDGVDSAGNFPGSAGIAGISTTGNVTIDSTTAILVDNGLLPNAGIYGETGGAGTVTITSNASIFAGDTGISANAVDGDITINNFQLVGAAFGSGIDAESTGLGGITITSTANVGSTLGDGISAENSGTAGDILINSTGATITAGVDGIIAVASNAGGTGLIQIDNASDITASGVGISASQAGSGGVVINNGGFISGDAVSGIVALDTNAVGGVSIVNTGSGIGSALNGVTNFGIQGVSGGGGTNIQSTGGPIYSDNVGISALDTGAGAAFVFTTASSTVTAGTTGLQGQSSGGLVSIANNAAVTSGGDGVLAINTTGGISVGSSGAISATGGDAINSANGAGNTTIFTVAGGTLNASDDGIDASSTTGSIDVDTADAIVAGDRGITVAASGAGVVTVDTGASSTINSGGDGINASSVGGTVSVSNLAAITATAGDGIEASTTGAAITVAVNSTISAGLNGVLTSNGGTGTTGVTAAQNITATGAGLAAINTATTGTGATTVTINNGRTIQNVNGSAVRTASAGGAVGINTGTGSTIVGAGAGATSWVVDMTNSGAGVSTLTIGSGTTVRSTDNTATGYDDLAIRGVGGSAVVGNAGRINGRVSFAGLTGTVAMTNTGVWHTTGASTFGPGADSLTNSATGSIFTNAGGVATSWDFGAGADTFTNAGLLVVGEPTLAASTLTVTNLEAWNNSGRIVFGSSGTTLTAVSDGQINDRIIASGTTFTGSGSSRLVMDANLGATVQTSCATLTAADCFGLTGGSTAGSTQILVNDVSPNPYGAFNPTGIVLVDVSGAGTTAASHFSLDPNSDYWRADANSSDGVLDKGLFFYDLALNLNKQHVLVGLPDGEAFEFTTFGTAVQNLWYTTTGVWHERQADVRDQAGSIDGSGAGVWVKVAGSATDRDLINSYDVFGKTYSFDTSYNQDTVALIGGLDFMGGGDGKVWAIGGQIGYVDSDVTFNASPTLTSFKGMTLGLSGTYISGPLFIDGIVNANKLDYDHQAITLAPTGSNIFTGSVDTLGFQIEGGYTIPLGENGFFEPSGVVSYLTSSIDTASVPGADIKWDDQTSFRASLGGRLGINADAGTFSTKWSLVARYWNEFEGDNQLVIQSAGPDLRLNDDFSGSFGEVGGTINVFSGDDRFSAFLNLGVKFKDDYQSTDGSLGFRWRW